MITVLYEETAVSSFFDVFPRNTKIKNMFGKPIKPVERQFNVLRIGIFRFLKNKTASSGDNNANNFEIKPIGYHRIKFDLRLCHVLMRPSIREILSKYVSSA